MESLSPLDPEFLHRHAPGLRALARTLVLDDNRVDDVVQQTWLAALQSPPQDRETAHAWLATVARRVAARFRRDDQRRERRERHSARPESLPGTEEIVGRELARREVVDAVFELDEPYRSSILYRFFEGLTPGEIAARQRLPVETVRTRIKRAMARLRQRLDQNHDGDRRAWHLALLPLAKLPIGVALGGASAGGAATTAVTTASLAGAPFAWAAVLLALAGLGALLLLDPLGLISPGAPDGEPEIVAELEPVPGGADTGADAELVLRRAPDEGAASGVSARVLELRAGQPLAGVSVRLSERDPRSADLGGTRLVRTGAGGELHAGVACDGYFASLSDPFYYLAGDRRLYAGAEAAALHAELGGRIAGRLQLPREDARENHAEQAFALLIGYGDRQGRRGWRGWGGRAEIRQIPIARDGRFAFDALPAGAEQLYDLHILTAGYAPLVFERLEVEPGGVHRLEIPLNRGVALRGVVRGPAGEGLAGAVVELFLASNWGGAETPPAGRIETDAQGAFELRGLVGSSYELVARAAGCVPRQLGGLNPSAEGLVGLELSLEAGRAITGIIVDEADLPQPDVEVRVALAGRARGAGPGRGGRAWRERRGGRHEAQILSDAAGRFSFDTLPLGTALELTAARRDGAFGRAQVAAEDPGDLRVVLQRGADLRLALSLTPRSPAPVEVRVALLPRGQRAPEIDRTFIRPETLEFVLPGMRPGAYRLVVEVLGHAPSEREIELAAGPAERKVELALERGLTLAGSATLESSGEPVCGAEVHAIADVAARMKIRMPPAFTDERGLFRIENLPPGSYRLVARHPSYTYSGAPTIALGSDPAPVCDLRFAPTGGLHGRILNAAGEPAARVKVVALPVGEPREEPALRSRFTGVISDEDGNFEIPRVTAGEYDVSVYSRNFGRGGRGARGARGVRGGRGGLGEALATERVSVEPGAVCEVELQLPPGSDGLTLVGHVLDAGAPVSGGSVQLLDGMRRARIDAAGQFRIENLPPGRHHLGVSPGSGSGGERAARSWGGAHFEFQLAGEGVIERDFHLGQGQLAGVVLGQNGAPLEVPVYLSLEGDRGSRLVGLRRTGADGHFAFEYLDAGSYRIVVAEPPELRGKMDRGGRGPRSEHAPAALAVELGAGEARRDLRFTLDVGATLVYELVDELGRAVRGTLLLLGRDANTEGMRRLLKVDASGRGRAAGLSPGRWAVLSDGASHALAPAGEIVLVAGVELEQSFALRAGHEFELEVLDADMQPVVDARIRVTTLAGLPVAAYPARMHRRGCAPRREGLYALGRLAAGRYEVRVQRGSEPRERANMVLELSGRSRQTLVLPRGEDG